MPLVILEGPDGSGKSTLAARLLKGTGHYTLLVKRSGPPGDVETLDFMVKWLVSNSSSNLNVIADRHPIISETLYAPHVRKVTPLLTVQEVLRAIGNTPGYARPLVIYCRAPLERMTQTSRVEDQMEGVHENYIRLVAAYDDFMTRLTRLDFDVYRYDFTEDGDSSRAIAKVKDFWEDHSND